MDEIRNLLLRDEAHAGFERAIEGVDPARVGEVRGHSLWQLLEHMRRAQHDLLRYMTEADYTDDLAFPDDYWPPTPGPASANDWQRSVAQFRADHRRVVALAGGDLRRPTPSAPGHSLLRDLLVLADHNAYHLGQIVLVRKLLGDWDP